MILFVWAIVAAVILMRGIAAFNVPLIGDEAYYWEWSRRLAFGYVDHPPAVAWTIAAFSPLGLSPFWVRSGFVLAGAVATVAVAACATEIARGDRRAGAAAALAFSLAPLLSMAFGPATPDGPFLAFWALALWLAARAFRRNERWTWIALGFALGGVLLSRFFGWALVLGIVTYALAPSRRAAWQHGLGASLAIAFACYLPFVAWNANHDWATFAFTFAQRHVAHGFSVKRVVMMYLVQAAAYSPGIWIGALICAARPRDALLAWTAIPLVVLLTVLMLFEPVEIHWVFGAFTSLCVALGVAYVSLSHRPKVIWGTSAIVPAMLLLPLIFVASVAPGDTYQVFRNSGYLLRNTGPFEIFTSNELAHNVKLIARERNAIVMTDGYGLSSVMDFYGDIPPLVIGYNHQGYESRRWVTHIDGRRNALFVDKESLVYLDASHVGRPDFAQRLQRACTHVRIGPTLHYDGGMGVPPRPYYLTWCDGLDDDGLHVLRWDTPADRRVARSR